MPLHDYHCTACQHDFEALVRASGPAPACPQCGSTALDRQLSRIAPHATTPGIVAAGRRAAAQEGHFSNYSAADRSKALKAR
jgi:putative FmdB family regulatory protein